MRMDGSMSRQARATATRELTRIRLYQSSSFHFRQEIWDSNPTAATRAFLVCFFFFLFLHCSAIEQQLLQGKEQVAKIEEAEGLSL